MVRYKTAAENAEKVEDELKAEKRKLQREVGAAGGWFSDQGQPEHTYRRCL